MGRDKVKKHQEYYLKAVQDVGGYPLIIHNEDNPKMIIEYIKLTAMGRVLSQHSPIKRISLPEYKGKTPQAREIRLTMRNKTQQERG